MKSFIYDNLPYLLLAPLALALLLASRKSALLSPAGSGRHQQA